MAFIKPMLAKPLPGDFDPQTAKYSGTYTAEPKFDGHRHLIRVRAGKVVDAWSTRMVDALRKMDEELQEQCVTVLGDGVYDGELHLEKGTSSDVAALDNRSKLLYTIFDCLELDGRSIMHRNQSTRVGMMRGTYFSSLTEGRVILAESYPIISVVEMIAHAQVNWEQGGEGLIIKHAAAPYSPGKRTNAWFKVKATKSTVVTIHQYFRPHTATEYGRVLCQDKDGIKLTVRVPNLELKRRCLEMGDSVVGKQLRIDYQQRTPKGSYRHPRWDRFEEE